MRKGHHSNGLVAFCQQDGAHQAKQVQRARGHSGEDTKLVSSDPTDAQHSDLLIYCHLAPPGPPTRSAAASRVQKGCS